MADDREQEAALDWGSASVDDGQLTVPLIGEVPSGWTKRAKSVVERLDRSGSSWGAIRVTKKQLRVDAVTAGSEHDVHHFLESVVLQANAAFREEEQDGDDDGRSEQDQEMTDAFRALATDRADQPG
jgi:hypothetical protein